MKSLWNDTDATPFLDDPLLLRVYTSQLLGKEPALVLHGGGNTSVKTSIKNLFGDKEDILFVKGSGWDLATIKTEGFAGVKLSILQRLAELDQLSDTDMVKQQKSAMIDPSAPSPSVEAILHAVIPYKFVDHTHADAVVTITNTANGLDRIRQIYDDKVLIIPYVMPGFLLAKKIYEMTKTIDWTNLDAMILMNHGVFSFADNAKTSYLHMINIVTLAEEYLSGQGAISEHQDKTKLISTEDLLTLSTLRKIISEQAGRPMIGRLNDSAPARDFTTNDNIKDIASRGPLTPDHIIRTKRIPLILDSQPLQNVKEYCLAYKAYFERQNSLHNASLHSSFKTSQLTCLDPAPRWVVWPGRGVVAFGENVKTADIIGDITRHTMRAILCAEKLGGWHTLGEQDLFEVEYWELEQAKLQKNTLPPPLQGKIALVTGAASGIGRACVTALAEQGAAVIALDIEPKIESIFSQSNIAGQTCDITNEEQTIKAIHHGIAQYGGLDILVNNAGIFPPSASIADLSTEIWNKSLAINLSAQQLVLKTCIPFLATGIEAAVVFIASKNVAAPGPGAAAYSVAKAGVTQLARVAALELAPQGIRVNTLHPDAVFDTSMWTPEVLEKRAAHYRLSCAEYKAKNLLKTEIKSRDVAALVCALASPLFAKTTGAQIPIDAGNDRVI